MTSEKQYSIALLPGDGIGPAIVDSAVRVLNKVAETEGFVLAYTEADIGGVAYDRSGDPFPQKTMEVMQSSDAVLFGAVGGPQYDALEPTMRPEAGLLRMRSALGLFANLRPAKLYQAMQEACPLRKEVREAGIDLVIVRELTGGIYFGERGGGGEGENRFAYDTEKYSVKEIERISRVAFDLAGKRSNRLTLVDKANVLSSSRLWREIVGEISKEFPEVAVDYLYVDNAAMQLVKRPQTFDVILTSNIFGDILSDEAAQIIGSIGLLPSASLGVKGTPAVYEPIHGSAPDIAGKNLANPLGTILSAAMMLNLSLGESKAAQKIEQAVETVLNQGYRTADLAALDKNRDTAKLVGTSEITDRLLAAL